MPAHILIIEDEIPIATLLGYNLEAEGYTVNLVHSGDEVEPSIKETMPSLIILDWMLPGVSGIEICRRLRASSHTAKLPIIMLTARGEEDEKVRGLSVGADDYLVKPFSVPELIARIKSLLRRSNPSLVENVLRSGKLTLDRETHRVSNDDTLIHLGPTEFRLLEFLMKTPSRVYSREQLLDNVWGQDIYVDERTVDVHIGRLRKALMSAAGKDPIRTVRGAGYAFDGK